MAKFDNGIDYQYAGGNYINAVNRLGFYNFGYTTHGYNYYHFKTNVTMSDIMVRIDAVGLAYAAALPIRCTWTFYAYAYNSTIYNVNLQSHWSGLQPYSVYKSVDGYACICGYCPAGGDMGFVLNSICPCPTGYGYGVGILSSAASTSGSNYW